ncbi:hypothetical protein A1507_15510 [Methylomonas koyamae]|uniref:Toxin-antitoxin system HicB family antitoxin n=1 Tax=Methylomonas koyamae TaxID=702114 RepID=A0A177NAG2_9GAMM|nr:type II toxin-antitoxin system HicB family antitoxin [Methylomonas koyamae]OAI14209.1 hypothetical protein A1507_15510 [Methylomonas koyamae]
MEILKYKGYEGTCEISLEDEICFGKILFINDLIMYQADSPREIKAAFQEAVDDYIASCAELGIEAKKPLKGQFNVRISPELHKQAVLRASQDDTSLNDVVIAALKTYLSPAASVKHTINVLVDRPTEQIQSISTSATNPMVWRISNARH